MSAVIYGLTMGSGSAGVACVETGRQNSGIDKTKEHFNYAKERIKQAQMSVPALLIAMDA